MSPLGLLVCTVSGFKRFAYQQGWLKQTRIEVPMIVVGNLSVGGAGKTPLVVTIARFLHQAGYQPGIICRGYKGQAKHWPQIVTPESDPVAVGDESVLLAHQTACPVVAGPDRVASAQDLLEQFTCDVVISDDGFQHLNLARDIDIVVIDSARGLGNRWCLPAGPLRESPRALRAADMLVSHRTRPDAESQNDRYQMILKPGEVFAADGTKLENSETLKQNPLHAIAGIGHPERFFNTLREQGFKIIEHTFPDHHYYQKSDLLFVDEYDIITTEKDALKLTALNFKQLIWVLPVQAVMEHNFNADLLTRLKQINHD